MSQISTDVDGTKIENVEQLLKKIGELEEKAYVQAVKDTLTKVLTPLTSLRTLLDRTIGNIEATIAMDNLVNKAAEEASPADVDAKSLKD